MSHRTLEIARLRVVRHIAWLFRLATVVAIGCGYFFWSPAAAYADISDQVCIPDGCLQGNTLSGGVYSFLGIPYAAPPTGDRRFRPPDEPIPWFSNRSAKAFGPLCARVLADTVPLTVNGSEDCLTLNVWAPAGSHAPSPVIVFIHTGGNARGSARQGSVGIGGTGTFLTNWDGQPWAAKGIVFVSVEFRLNALGFLADPALSAEDPHGSSGNYGVLDQIAALRWVQNNIVYFGGDPGNVTLLGTGSGATDVSVLVVSDLASGLFSRAILQSPFLGFPTLQQAEQSVGAQIVQGVGCATAVDVAACLRAKPFPDIVGAAPFRTIGGGVGTDDYFPRIDGWVLKGDPVDLIEGDLAPNKAALMMGSNADEINVAARNPSVADILDPNADEMAYKNALVTRFGVAAADQVFSIYPPTAFENSPLVLQNVGSSSLAAMLRVLTDALTTCPVRAFARRASTGHRPVYRYFFTHALENNANLNTLGAFSNEENWFVFKASPYSYSADELDLAGKAQSYWAAFATTGDPNGADRPSWPVYQRSDQNDNFLEINSGPDGLKAGDGVRTVECDFWNALDRKLHGDN